MSADKKREVIELVRRSPLPKRATLAEMGLARSTFYRWQRRYREHGETGLVDRKPEPGAVWNRLRPEEQERIVQEALRQPDLSPRELALYLSDHAGFSVSEASVYRVLRRHGLNRTVELVGFPAGKEYRVKTTAPNQQWQSDASYFFVVGWGWYYFISVLDDYSRLILAWDLKAGYDGRVHQRCGGASRRLHWHEAGAGGGPHQAAQRSRFRLPGPGLRGIFADAPYPAHSVRAASSSDQWQAGTFSRDSQSTPESTGLHQSGTVVAGHGRVHRVLQPAPLPRRHRQRRTRRCLLWAQRRNPTTKGGAETANHPTAAGVQSRSLQPSTHE